MSMCTRWGGRERVSLSDNEEQNLPHFSGGLTTFAQENIHTKFVVQ